MAPHHSREPPEVSRCEPESSPSRTGSVASRTSYALSLEEQVITTVAEQQAAAQALIFLLADDTFHIDLLPSDTDIDAFVGVLESLFRILQGLQQIRHERADARFTEEVTREPAEELARMSSFPALRPNANADRRLYSRHGSEVSSDSRMAPVRPQMSSSARMVSPSAGRSFVQYRPLVSARLDTMAHASASLTGFALTSATQDEPQSARSAFVTCPSTPGWTATGGGSMNEGSSCPRGRRTPHASPQVDRRVTRSQARLRYNT